MAALPEASAVIRAAGLAAGLFAAGALAAYISPALDKHPSDPLGQLIGSAKEVVGDAFFLKADEYMHGGVKGEFEHKKGDMQKEGLIAKLEGHGHEHERGDWIAHVNEEIRTHEHYHLKEGEKQEILPLLAASVSLDPYNVEAILTTAYWLERHFGKVDAAAHVLEKGRKDNPGSWEIEAALGEIWFKHRKDYDRAAAHTSAAVEKLGGGDVPRATRVELYMRLADSHTELGHDEEELRYLEAVAMIFGRENVPLAGTVRSRIAELKARAAR